MKKMTLAIVICLSLITAVAARPGSSSFLCDIDVSKMPQGAIYVDMLFPLEKAHEKYCEYNDEAGKKTGIPQNSEIVRYEKDGFRSYTFHIDGAHSEIKPYKENDGFYYVSFFEDKTGYDGKMFSDIDDFGKKYKRVKFAYLNAKGDIIAETNEMTIWKGRWYWKIYISICGDIAECSMAEEFPLLIEIYLRLIPFAFIVFALWGVVNAVLKRIKKPYMRKTEK